MNWNEILKNNSSYFDINWNRIWISLSMEIGTWILSSIGVNKNRFIIQFVHDIALNR